MKRGLGLGWWLLGFCVVGLLVGLVLAVAPHLRWPERPNAAAPVPPRISAGDQAVGTVSSAMAESASLLGAAPLFLPTPLNGSLVDVPPSARREPGSSFPMVAPHFVYEERSFSVAVSDPRAVPESPLAILNYGQTVPPFAVLGRFDGSLEPLPQRTLYVEATAAGQGRVAFASAFQADGAPLAFRAEWRPMELLVAVDAAGQISEPAVVQGSGVPDVDRYVADFLEKNVKLGLRVLPGFYAVRVGP